MDIKYYQFIAEKIHPAEAVEMLKKIMSIKRKHYFLGNLDLYIDPVSHFGLRIMRDKSYEPDVRELIEEILQPGDTFIDLGGNEGYFSLVASKKVGTTGRVFCIEPQERLWKVILKNLTSNECFNIQLLPFAIAAEKGEVELVLTPSINTGSSKVGKSLRTAFWARQKARTFPLDEVIEKYNINHVKLIKIDIEGYELFALQSAIKSLKKGIIENLIIEVHPPQLEQLNQSTKLLLDFLSEAGYRQTAHYEKSNLYIFKKV